MLLEMAKTADVFLQNARPGAADRNGFGYEALSAVNEELIYVSISGFGEKGPYVGKRVYDPVIQGPRMSKSPTSISSILDTTVVPSCG